MDAAPSLASLSSDPQTDDARRDDCDNDNINELADHLSESSDGEQDAIAPVLAPPVAQAYRSAYNETIAPPGGPLSRVVRFCVSCWLDKDTLTHLFTSVLRETLRADGRTGGLTDEPMNS